MMTEVEVTTSFEQDIVRGLTASSKYLLPKYFYDEKGSQIFQNIMRMPEYYLTDCEMEIIESHKHDIFEAFNIKTRSFDLIELGAGDGLKTMVLLSYFHEQNVKFRFIPVDISPKAIQDLVKVVSKELPAISVSAQIGDYFEMIGKLNTEDGRKKIFLFLGSNIGNYNDKESLDFLKQLNRAMNTNDQLLIGFDLKKDPGVVLKAYNDPHGYTAAFNINLLQRINDELGADFELNSFIHQESYDYLTGTAKSHMISQKQQKVTIAKLKQVIYFEQGEKIFMEMSQKYDLDMINRLAEKSGFRIVRNYFDQRQFFVNSLWTKIKN
jgi:dimethylhistidine N-methyltransferase